MKKGFSKSKVFRIIEGWCESLERRTFNGLTGSRSAFTMACGGQAAFIRGGQARGFGFTMAEILLSLTIIGVVAAITLPSLTGNINERTWNTQRKALYARMSQAISLMPALNGYGTYSKDEDGNVTDTAAETFVTDGLAKVLKINNICDNEHLKDCGISQSFTNMVGSSKEIPTTLYSLYSWFATPSDQDGKVYSILNTKPVAFETQNHESIVAYYNQNCITEFLNSEVTDSFGSSGAFVGRNMCVNFIYDLNGIKGPNTIGKDMGFITVFNAMDSIVVAPMPATITNANNNLPVSNWNLASRACTTQSTDSRVPNIDELSSMMINSDLINLIATASVFWSGSSISATHAWGVATYNGRRFLGLKTLSNESVRCIRR